MSKMLISLLNALFVLLTPLIVVLGSARLLATEQYLTFEYSKADFPSDLYGLDPSRRFALASANMRYVRDNLPGEALAGQTLDGELAYTPREVVHMADVQAAFQSAWRIWQVSVILLLLGGSILLRVGGRAALTFAIQWGGLLTSGIILTIALLALFAWQVWFDSFHLFFFKPGSWLFDYSDMLIRLFPIQFWIDATFAISTMTLIGGLLLAFSGWRWRRVLGKGEV